VELTYLPILISSIFLPVQVADPDMFVFVDESAVSGTSASRRYGHGRHGRRLEPKEFFRTRGMTNRSAYTLIAAVDINGFLTSACTVVRRKAKNSTNPAHGTIDKLRFLDWVLEDLVPTLGDFSKGEPRSVVIMDNASVHKHPGVVEAIEGAGALIIWTAAYSPDLNPIERCFFKYKRYLERHGKEQHAGCDRFHWHTAALIECVDHETMCNYYNATEMQGCIRNVPEFLSTDVLVGVLVAIGVL
jgi:hypothetical protein